MISHGVTLNAAVDALKRALYDSASDIVSQQGKSTDSRISLLTGLHRKDVKRLKDDPETLSRRKVMNANALAISIWMSAEAFLDDAGNPKILARIGNKHTVGFDNLMQEARIDLPPQTVLSALLEEGAVEENADGTEIALVSNAFVASAESET